MVLDLCKGTHVVVVSDVGGQTPFIVASIEEERRCDEGL